MLVAAQWNSDIWQQNRLIINYCTFLSCQGETSRVGNLESNCSKKKTWNFAVLLWWSAARTPNSTGACRVTRERERERETQPPTVACKKWKFSRKYVHVAYMFSHVWAPTRMLSRCLLTRVSASELSRKLIKSALLVGWERLSLAR